MGNDCTKASTANELDLATSDFDSVLGDVLSSQPPASPASPASGSKAVVNEKPRRVATVSESTATRYSRAIAEHQFDAMEGMAKGIAQSHDTTVDNDACDAQAMRRLMKEINGKLAKDLDANYGASMFLRVDEERPQYLRALLSGLPGTPYESGLFVFDILVPSNYPTVNPHVKHTTPGASNVASPGGYSPGGFSPNLHQHGGQVCLSLLGTWSSGTGWSSEHNIYTVLSAIQQMILSAEHPYYMEPSYGGWEGTAPTSGHEPEVIEYDEIVKNGTARYAMLDILKNPPQGFEEAVRAHFLHQRQSIMETLEYWSEDGSPSFRQKLEPVRKELLTLLQELGDEPEEEPQEPQLARENSCDEP